jgi:hypothetical protein
MCKETCYTCVTNIEPGIFKYFVGCKLDLQNKIHKSRRQMESYGLWLTGACSVVGS